MAKRGSDPDDLRRFSGDEIKKLEIAQQEIQWLLDRGYKMAPVIDLIGKHHQLTVRQLTALQRATASQQQYRHRSSILLPLSAARDGCIYIDGFNLIITLEVALSGSILILGRDAVIRDLAGLRGTYRIIDVTSQALDLIGESLTRLVVPKAKFYLDAPVSNSGKLRGKILEHAANWNLPTEVELVNNADSLLSRLPRVVTGDSQILDSCSSWFNLSRAIIETYVQDAWIVRLS